MEGSGKDRDERVALLATALEEGAGSQEDGVEPLVSPAEIDRERYAERRSRSLLIFAVVVGGGELASLLLVGHADPFFGVLAFVALVGATMWWQRSQGPDD